MSKASDRERESAREMLREFVKPGMTVYTTLRHRSRSGMFRLIDLHVIEDNEPRWIGYTAGQATGIAYDRDRNGLRLSGTGMDMGFAAVYELAQALYPEGFGCIGERCPSNDHSNGDRDRTPHALSVDELIHGRNHEHWHKSGGYALRHRWL